MKVLNAKLREKFIEALKAVLPIVAIVLILGFTIAPVTPSVLLCFLVGTVMVMAGMMFFTLGAEMSMTPMGEKVGACMTKSKKIIFIVIMSFVLGVIITISEPDLQVLASQVPSVPNMTLILSVAAGLFGDSSYSYANRNCTSAIARILLHYSIYSYGLCA